MKRMVTTTERQRMRDEKRDTLTPCQQRRMTKQKEREKALRLIH